MAEHFHFIWLSQLLQTLQKSGGVAVVAAERIAAIAADDVGRNEGIVSVQKLLQIFQRHAGNQAAAWRAVKHRVIDGNSQQQNGFTVFIKSGGHPAVAIV